MTPVIFGVDIAKQKFDAARLCEDDPYFRHGLRTGYQIYAWGKAPIYDDVIL